MNAAASIAVSVALVGVLAPAAGQQLKPTAATGTAIVSGAVISSADATTPVRRAIVKLSGRGELSRSAVTDDDGRFAIGFLPGGTYALTVSKPAWLTTTFGAAGPGRAGTPVVIREGETIANLRIPLTRGAAISGTVRDQAGTAAEGVQVFVARAELSRGRQSSGSFTSTSSVDVVTTDDLGGYRIFGLPPGSYVVGALSKVSTAGGIGAPTRDQIDADLRMLQQRATGASSAAGTAVNAGPPPPLVGYAPTYHPSAVSATQAATVTVEAGEDRGGTDIFLALAPQGAIEGVVLGVDGQPAPAVSLNISTIGPPMPRAFGLFPSSPLPGPDGRFRFSSVAPGTWTITARSSARVIRRNADGSLAGTSGAADELPPGTFYWAAATIDVNGGTTSVTLQLRPGLTMTGRVVFERGAQQPAPVATQVRLSMTPDTDPARAATALFPGAPPAAATPAADGSFELKGLTSGPWVLTALVPGATGPGGWWLRSAMVNGKDLLDAPLAIGDQPLTNVELRLSKLQTEIAGTLLAADGQPASHLVIVAMPEDRALWTSTRRVQQARPSTDGRFSFVNLPPGAYLLAAVTDVAADAWRTTEFLAAVAPAGVKVVLGEGGKTRQDLRIGGR